MYVPVVSGRSLSNKAKRCGWARIAAPILSSAKNVDALSLLKKFDGMGYGDGASGLHIRAESKRTGRHKKSISKKREAQSDERLGLLGEGKVPHQTSACHLPPEQLQIKEM